MRGKCFPSPFTWSVWLNQHRMVRSIHGSLTIFTSITNHFLLGWLFVVPSMNFWSKKKQRKRVQLFNQWPTEQCTSKDKPGWLRGRLYRARHIANSQGTYLQVDFLYILQWQVTIFFTAHRIIVALPARSWQEPDQQRPFRRRRNETNTRRHYVLSTATIPLLRTRNKVSCFFLLRE